MEGIWIVSYFVLWVFVILLAVLVLLLFRQIGIAYMGTLEGVRRGGLRVGAKAPEFEAYDQSGDLVKLVSLRGRWVLLVFGSAECDPCRTLLPDLGEFAKARADTMETLLLSASDAQANRSLAAEHETPFRVLTVNGSELGNAYDVTSTPFTFLLDQDGIVRNKGLVNRREHLESIVEDSLSVPSSVSV